MKSNIFNFTPLFNLLILMLVTGIALYAYKWLPKRSYNAMGGEENILSLYDDGEYSRANWVDRERHQYKCTYESTPAPVKYCGLDISQGDGATQGVDLSLFDSINIEFMYIGEADLLRVGLRNYLYGYSTPEKPIETAQFINGLIFTKDIIRNGVNTVSIDLKSMRIPEWWLHSADTQPKIFTPKFNNITHLGLDVPYPAPHGDHILSVVSMKFEGEYIAKDQWYLLIIIIWAIKLIVLVTSRQLRLMSEVKISQTYLKTALKTTKQLRSKSEKFKELAFLDPLSQLINRRGILEYYQENLSSKSDEDFCLLYIDIDLFKAINDNYGHNVGDMVIQKMAEMLKSNLREADIVGRWGGEEFIIICPDCCLDSAKQIADKLLKSAQNLTFEEYRDLKLTISIGISNIDTALTMEENFIEADEALYRAKNSGRNCWKSSKELTSIGSARKSNHG